MMAEQETKTRAAGKKNKYWFNNRGNQTTKTSYKSKVVELEDDVFDVGALSDPAKFSKLLKSIRNYIQKNYKTCDDILKAIQQLKRPTLAHPKQPTRAQYTNANGDFDKDGFDLAKFAWKDDYKGMKYQMDKYNDNESMRGHSYTSHFKASCSGICEHSCKIAQETMMMTSSDRKMNECAI